MRRSANSTFTTRMYGPISATLLFFKTLLTQLASCSRRNTTVMVVPVTISHAASETTLLSTPCFVTAIQAPPKSEVLGVFETDNVTGM